MSEFNCNLYKVKGVFAQDETEPIITGFYYQDEHGRHFIIDDKDFKHYETNPYTLCRNTGMEIDGKFLYEYDVVSYCEPMRDKKEYGYIEYDDFRKCYVVRHSIEQRSYRTLRDCSKVEITGKNIVLSDKDFKWFDDYTKSECEKSKSYVIDNSYCPSKFKR